MGNTDVSNLLRPRLGELIDRSADGMILVDGEGVVSFANKAATAMFGRNDVADIVGSELGVPMFAGETTELELVRPDGKPIWVELRTVDAREFGEGATLATLRDVTERRAAEKQLADSEGRYRLLADNTSDLISRHRSGGRFAYASASARRLIGRDDEMLRDVPLTDLTHDDDRERVAELFSATSSQPRRDTYRIRHAEGHFIWAETTCRHVPGTDDDGEAQWVAVTRDVTKQRELESQLQHAQKMEAVGRLAGGVAHDFNNLLTVITGYCELLLERERLSHTTQSGELREIRRAAEGAFTLTKQLLSFARQHQARPKTLDLNKLIERMFPLLKAHVGEAVEIDFIREQVSPLNVHLDANLFEQVVVNLVVNARDAMAGAGHLTLQTKAGDGVATLDVSDTGSGMGHEVRDRIFEPFFTTKGVDEGTGLGLSTAFGIIKQSGGNISVESEVGQGTTFSVELPLAKTPIDESVASSMPSVCNRPASRGRVLLVEDQAMLRRLLRRVISAAGFEAVAAEGPREALSLVDDLLPGASFDVLLTDVVMPEMKGPELAARIVSQHPKMPVIYMSGYTDGEVASAKNRPKGEFHFLQKPFTPEQLVDLLIRVANADQ